MASSDDTEETTFDEANETDEEAETEVQSGDENDAAAKTETEAPPPFELAFAPREFLSQFPVPANEGVRLRIMDRCAGRARPTSPTAWPFRGMVVAPLDHHPLYATHTSSSL